MHYKRESQVRVCLAPVAKTRLVLFITQLHFLNIDSLLYFVPSLYRRLYESLPRAKLAESPRLFEFTFELFQSFFNILALFYRYYNHSANTSFCYGAQR